MFLAQKYRLVLPFTCESRRAVKSASLFILIYYFKIIIMPYVCFTLDLHHLGKCILEGYYLNCRSLL